MPLVSVIVTNHNYGRFLDAAIGSVLAQTYSHAEVIVVDDGSTDESRQMIRGYGAQIVPLLKQNGGQTSAMNAGFELSRGEIVCFLDADDMLLPSALQTVVARFRETDIVNVHWPLWVVDEHGTRTGRRDPSDPVPEGDLRDLVLHDGPDALGWSPTSGNAWARSFLRQVFPLTEMEGKLGVGSASADSTLSMLAPLFGRIRGIEEPQGCYRLHHDSDYSSVPFGDKLAREVRLFDHRSAVLHYYCRRLGIPADPEMWKRNSWRICVATAVQEIEGLIPSSEPFILVDDASWGMTPGVKHRPIPFLERDGQYWGLPADDRTAIAELERLRKRGVHFIVFGWPAFWWFDCYSRFHQYLRTRFACILESERVVAFDLRPSTGRRE